MSIYGIYTFDVENDADCQAFTYTSINGGSGQSVTGVIASAGSAAQFCHDTNGGNSTNVGPDQGQGGVGDGYLYTDCSSPGAIGDEYTMEFGTALDASLEQWQFNFYTCQRGSIADANQSRCEVQINENGGGWSTISSFGGAGDDTTDGTLWTPRTVDLSQSGVNVNSSTLVRILITNDSSTAWYGDYGIDTVSIVGTPILTGYDTVFSALLADHHWSFDGDSIDDIGSAHGTDNSMIYTSISIAKDSVNCAQTNAIADRVSIPTTTNINNSAQARKTVCGWFSTTEIQNPPKNIYGEGDASESFRFILGWGNYLMFEVDNGSVIVQIFGDTPLEINRPYHLLMTFENNTYGNEVRAYLDGVEQLNANPINRQPGSTSLPVRSVGEFGDPAGTVGVGGVAVILLAPINGKWSHWGSWGDKSEAILTNNQIRVNLFEQGALADITISSDTNSIMQSQLNAYNSSLRANAPCCIEIESVAGGGDFELDLFDMTFDPLASIHVRYNGEADTLTLLNMGTSNCSIVSSPYGGNVIVKSEVILMISVFNINDFTEVSGATVFIKADVGGDLPEGTVIMKTSTNEFGGILETFQYTSDQPIIGYARQGTNSTYFKPSSISGPITSDGLTQTVLLIPDE